MVWLLLWNKTSNLDDICGWEMHLWNETANWWASERSSTSPFLCLDTEWVSFATISIIGVWKITSLQCGGWLEFGGVWSFYCQMVWGAEVFACKIQKAPRQGKSDSISVCNYTQGPNLKP